LDTEPAYNKILMKYAESSGARRDPPPPGVIRLRAQSIAVDSFYHQARSPPRALLTVNTYYLSSVAIFVLHNLPFSIYSAIIHVEIFYSAIFYYEL